MAIKYHINPSSGADGNSEENAYLYYEKEPILHTLPTLIHKSDFAFFKGLDVDYDSYGPPGDSYDSYGPPSGDCYCDDDDACRCSVYENIRFSEKYPIDKEDILKRSINWQPESKPLPEGLRKLGDEFELDNINNYEIITYQSYYGEEHTVVLKDDRFEERIKEWGEKNTIPKDDIIGSVLVSHGIDPRKRDNLAEFKKILKDENAGIENSRVERCTEIESKRMSIDRVKVPNQHHFDRVLPRKASAPANTPQITGVVVKEGGDYVLVDGYHRMKNAKSMNQKTGVFIVLS